MKGMHTGELEAVEKLKPYFEIRRFGETSKFVFLMSEQEKRELAADIQDELKEIFRIMEENYCHILILDEILGCIQAGLVSEQDVLEILDAKPESMELVLTGRGLTKK